MLRACILAIFVLLSVTAPSTPALAGNYVDGNRLLRDCRTQRGTPTYFQSDAVCSAYILGVMDTLDMNRFLKTGMKICLPEKVPASQARDVAVAYLEKNPAERHGPAAMLVTFALLESFACR